MTRARRSTPAILVALIAAMAAATWYAGQMPIDISPVPFTGEPAAEATRRPLLLPQPPTPEVGDDFVTRPLFSETRRPSVPRQPDAVPETSDPDASVAAQAAAEPVPSGLRFIGLMSIGNRSQRALLRSGEAASGVWVDVGGEINGWRVAKIEPDRVTLENAGEVEHLVLRRGADAPIADGGPQPR